LRKQAVTLWFLLSLVAFAQTATPATSDPQAITLAAQSITALTRGTNISDVTLSGTATWIVGGQNFSGPVTLKALGASQSRVDLNLNGLQRSEIRAMNNGIPAIGWIDASGTHKGAEHNCYTESVWFLPALWSFWNTSNTQLTANFLGTTTYNSVSAEQLLLHEYASDQVLNALSATNVYIAPTSFLPLGITFKAHPDTNALVDVPVEVRFANYQNISGVMVPFRIQKLLNGSLMLDITVQSANINSGLSATDFTIQ